jgi:hypothetical protein
VPKAALSRAIADLKDKRWSFRSRDGVAYNRYPKSLVADKRDLNEYGDNRKLDNGHRDQENYAHGPTPSQARLAVYNPSNNTQVKECPL